MADKIKVMEFLDIDSDDAPIREKIENFLNEEFQTFSSGEMSSTRKLLKDANVPLIPRKKIDVDNVLWGDKTPKYADGGNTLFAPNGKPSNLTLEQYNLVRTPNFKAWFGDWENDPANASKVVDENGEPLVLWRGESEKTRNVSGFWLTKSKGYAEFILRSLVRYHRTSLVIHSITGWG